MKLFKEENFKVVISDEAKLIPEFKKLITRDRSKNKNKSLSELSFIYFMYDYRSPYMNQASESREQVVKKEVGLESSWKPDKAVKVAIEKYKKLTETPSMAMLVELRETLLTSRDVVAMLRGNLQSQLKTLTEPSDDVQEDPEGKASANRIKSMMSNVKQLFDVSEQLPRVIQSIEGLEDKVKKEKSTTRKIKGGGSENYFEE